MLAVSFRKIQQISSSSSPLLRFVRPHSSVSSASQFVVSLHSWKLTHQPREPTLHWNPRFRTLQAFDTETEPSTENWDLWFDKEKQKVHSFLSDQSYLFEFSMAKRQRDSSPIIEEIRKRPHHHHHHEQLPKRLWTNTPYEERLATSHHEHFLFHLISYNILAQRLIEDNPLLYEKCPEHHLFWNRRRDRLLKEILQQNADIVCLQEMQHEHYRRDFRPAMAEEGYDSIYIKRSGDKFDGCCLFYKTHRLRLVNSRTVPFFHRHIQILDRDNCGLMALFQPVTADRNSNDFFCVATTHLLFSPKRGDIKLAQVQYFLAEIDRFASKDSTGENFHPIIFCGDFNAHPQSPLMNFLTNGQIQYDTFRRIEISGQIPPSMIRNRFSLPLPSNELLPSSFVTSDCRFPSSRQSTDDENQRILQAFLHRTHSSRLTHNKRFQSAYDLDEANQVTTRIDNEANFVDYILYSRQENDRHRLNLLGRYELYDAEQMNRIHLPNHQFASDHFLLAAKFALKLHQKKKK